MEYVNQVILAGVVADEPVGRRMGNGKPEYVAAIRCIDRWTDGVTGRQRERIDWLRIVFYGPLGDQASQIMRKGAEVQVRGRLRTRDLNNNHHAERNATFVEVVTFEMLGAGSLREASAFESEFGPLRHQSAFLSQTSLGETS